MEQNIRRNKYMFTNKSMNIVGQHNSCVEIYGRDTLLLIFFSDTEVVKPVKNITEKLIALSLLPV